MQVLWKKLEEGAMPPMKATQGSAGLDLSALANIVIPPLGGRVVVKTGIQIFLPSGTYGRVAGRSGLARDFGIIIGGGVIDADYRGEIKVLLFNLSTNEYYVRRGSRIAQLVIEKCLIPDVVREITDEEGADDDYEVTKRGIAGFGSTGYFKM